MAKILENIPYYSKVKTKVKSWFHADKPDVDQFRGSVMGTIITTSIAEVGMYKMLQQNVINGDLPSITTDVLIIVTAILEAVVGPYIAWYGFKNRRTTLMSWALALFMVSWTWYAMPAVAVNNNIIDPCDRIFVYEGYTSSALIRLLILTVSCMVFSLTRVASVAHGIAYLDQHDPDKISLHYGIFIIARVLPLLLADKIVAGDTSESNRFGLFMGSLVSLYQIASSMPKENNIRKESKENDSAKDNADNEKRDSKNTLKDNVEKKNSEDKEEEEKVKSNNALLQVERDFKSSIRRILGNKLLVYQMIGMGFMAAALWGFAFNHDDLIKAKYYIDPRRNPDENTTEVFRFIFLVITILYAATFFYPPLILTELLKKAKKLAVIMSGIACAIHVVLITSSDCLKGIIAGLDFDKYDHESMGCGAERCTPNWKEFSPVCVPDSMVTFLSPREAGCALLHEINGLQIFMTCTCSMTSQFAIATLGACSDSVCMPLYQFHLMLFLLLVIVSALSLQSQGMLVLRAVDRRDTAVVMGVASSIVSLLTFVVAHVIYSVIRENTCLWFEADRCHLQNEEFPFLVSITSALFAFLSVVFSLLAWRHRDKSLENVTDEKKIN